MQEQVHCDRCAKDTHRSSYTQYFFNVAATALRMMAMTVQMDLDDAHMGPGPPPKAPMSGLLKKIEAQVAKTCDTDEGERIAATLVSSANRPELSPDAH